MRCPKCGGPTHVIRTVKTTKRVTRRRRCLRCPHVFSTVEERAVMVQRLVRESRLDAL